jgi:hypothetical protein
MHKPATTTFLLYICLAATVVTLDGSQTLTVRVTPAMSREPASLKIQAVIEADDRNRSLEIVARSNGYMRSSQIQIDGRDAQRVWEIEFRDVPHGNYEVTATLMGNEGKRATATRVVTVLSQLAQ